MGLLDGVGFLLWITNTKPSSQQTEQNMIVDLHPVKSYTTSQPGKPTKKEKDSKEKTRMKGNLKKSEGEVVPTH